VLRALVQSQQQVAEAIGVPRWTYAMFESGMILPSPEVMESLCGLFNKTTDDLYPDPRSRAFYGGR